MYLSTSYEFPVLKYFYAVVLRESELGRKAWKDDFYCIETAILSKHTAKNNAGNKKRKHLVLSIRKNNNNNQSYLTQMKRLGFVLSTKETNANTKAIIVW